MNHHFRALWALVKENRRLYIGAVFCTLITVVIGFLTPLVFSETIDVLLSGLPGSLPEWMKAPVRLIGGSAFLRAHLWVVALLIVALNVISGVFSYFKEKNTAVAGENIAKSLRERLYRKLSYLSYG